MGKISPSPPGHVVYGEIPISVSAKLKLQVVGRGNRAALQLLQDTRRRWRLKLKNSQVNLLIDGLVCWLESRRCRDEN